MQARTIPAAQALTHETATQAFADWETAFREAPESFYTAEEVAAMKVADVAELQAIHFVALLRSQGYAAAENNPPTAPHPPQAPIAPPAIGQYMPGQGGVYIGICRGEAGQPDQHIIVATLPEASFKGVWGERGEDVLGAKHRFDGRVNTVAMADAGSEIAKRVLALAIDGHNDFFIGSQAMLALASANAPELFEPGYYWSSTQVSRYSAFVQDFEFGYSGWGSKNDEFRVRAFRALPLDHFNTSAEGRAV